MLLINFYQVFNLFRIRLHRTCQLLIMLEETTYCSNHSLANGVSLIWCIASSVILLYAAFGFRISYFRDKQSKKSKKHPISSNLLKLNWIMIISGTIMEVVALSQFIVCMLNIRVPVSMINVFWFVYFISYIICGISLAIVFVSRLHMVFNDSQYAYSTKTFILLFGLLISCVVCGVISLLFSVGLFDHIMQDTIHVNIDTSIFGFAFALIGLLIYFVLMITILTLFIASLFRVESFTLPNTLHKYKKTVCFSLFNIFFFFLPGVASKTFPHSLFVLASFF